MDAYKFSIARYVPDPIRGERLNIGVVVARSDPHSFQARFLNSRQLGRIRQVALSDDLSFVRDLADEMNASALGRLVEGPWTLEKLEAAAVGWVNTIQFTAPKVTLTDRPADLVAELFERYVANPRTKERVSTRGHDWARSHVRRQLTRQLTLVRPETVVEEVITDDPMVPGLYDPRPHRLDFGLGNGAIREYVHTLSLELKTDRVQTNIRELAWTLDDIRRNHVQQPISVVTIGNQDSVFATARDLFVHFDTRVVPETQVDIWAQETARGLAAALL